MKKRYLFFTIMLALVITFSFIESNVQVFFAAETIANESQVRVVQQRLRDWGYYDGPVTGYYGELTKAGVIRFQRKHGLNPEGYLGELTLQKIGINVAPTATAVSFTGDTPYDSTIIRRAQERLLNWGYFDGPVTGNYGPLTTAAVVRFQQKHGLNAEGYLGPQTLEKLGIFVPASTGQSYTNNADLDLLARCVYAEARGEPYAGQVAVAAVVLNRVNHPSFPNTISEVIYQPYAFTAVADRQIYLTPNQAAYNAARDALNGWDPTYGCLFYYNPAVATSQWMFNKPVATQIGKHVFAY